MMLKVEIMNQKQNSLLILFFAKMISNIYRYPSAQIVDHVHEVGDHTDGRIQVGGRIQTCDHQTILRRALCSDH